MEDLDRVVRGGDYHARRRMDGGSGSAADVLRVLYGLFALLLGVVVVDLGR